MAYLKNMLGYYIFIVKNKCMYKYLTITMAIIELLS
jgi:hypothetical protein